ncbi:MAG: 60S ribosomal L33 [Lasallia pustulata]|uniref:60S ribosomal L33 n=1 Tax=Lasallia pustulata TaxID=136370 RepID=A0A5M8Q1B9_9LECA|nr:MAG: 60S ribosomal L33 [Lasallia pustulata]
MLPSPGWRFVCEDHLLRFWSSTLPEGPTPEHQRRKRTRLIKIDGVADPKAANYHEKEVAFVCRAQRDGSCSMIKVIWGKVTLQRRVSLSNWSNEGTVQEQSASKIIWGVGQTYAAPIIHLAVRNRGRGYMRAGGSDGFGYQAAILGHNIACVDSNYGRLTSSALYLYWTRSIPPGAQPIVFPGSGTAETTCLR